MVFLGVMSCKAIKKVTYFLTGFYCLLKEYRIIKATKQEEQNLPKGGGHGCFGTFDFDDFFLLLLGILDVLTYYF